MRNKDIQDVLDWLKTPEGLAELDAIVQTYKTERDLAISEAMKYRDSGKLWHDFNEVKADKRLQCGIAHAEEFPVLWNIFSALNILGHLESTELDDCTFPTTEYRMDSCWVFRLMSGQGSGLSLHWSPVKED